MFWEWHKDGWKNFSETEDRNINQYEIDRYLIPLLQESIWWKLGDILDIWCGIGKFTARFQELMPNYQVYGIDKLYPFENQLWEDKIKYINWDIEQSFPYSSEKFQLCFSRFVIMYIQDLYRHFQQVSRILHTWWEYIYIWYTPEYPLFKQREFLWNINTKFGDQVENEIFWSWLKVNILLHSPEDYLKAISNSGFELISRQGFMHKRPRFSFAEKNPFAEVVRLKKS